MYCNTTKSAAATPAQKIGFCVNGTRFRRWGLLRYRRRLSLLTRSSGFGLVIRLTTIVTMTQISQDQRARYMSSAMALAWVDMAISARASGLNFTIKNMPTEERVPTEESGEASGGGGSCPEHT